MNPPSRNINSVTVRRSRRNLGNDQHHQYLTHEKVKVLVCLQFYMELLRAILSLLLF